MYYKLVCVGKLASKNAFQTICEDYKKRIKNELLIVEIKSNIIKRSERIEFEAKKITECLKKDKDVFLLDSSGNNYSSKAFSELFMQKKEAGSKGITFVIGGIYGLHKKIISQLNVLLNGMLATQKKCYLLQIIFHRKMVEHTC